MNKKTILNIVALALLVAGTCGWASGQATQPAKDETPDRAVVPLSNPAKPAKIEVSVMRGSITIRGYQGKEIIVEARTREKALTGWGALSTGYAPYVATVPGAPVPPVALAKPAPVPAPAAKSLKDLEQAQKALELAQKDIDTQVAKQMEEQLAKQAELAKKLEGQYARAGEFYNQFYQDDKKVREEKEKKIAGMKRLSGSSSGLEVEEEDNVVTINTQSWKAATDLDIQVPVASSLEIRSSMDGAVVIEGVSGEIDINNINGPVTLTNVSGNTLVHTVNGDITAVITRLATDKPSSFSTMTGDLDVTLPRDIKASLKMKSDQGEIYSDFDINMSRQPAKSEPAEETAQGKYRIAFDKSLVGTINGGGPEISFNTFRGDIYIRQKK